MSTGKALDEATVLRAGLTWAGFVEYCQERVQHETNDERFRLFYGSGARAVLKIYEDLFKVDPKLILLDCFMAMHLLKCYPTEARLAGTFRVSKKTARLKCWSTITKIQGLKNKKVSIYWLIYVSKLLYCFFANSAFVFFFDFAYRN